MRQSTRNGCQVVRMRKKNLRKIIQKIEDLPENPYCAREACSLVSCSRRGRKVVSGLGQAYLGVGRSQLLIQDVNVSSSGGFLEFFRDCHCVK